MPTLEDDKNKQPDAEVATPVNNKTDVATKLTQQQIDDKYKDNIYAKDRQNWGNYLNDDLPFSGTNVKQAVYSAANSTGVDPSLLFASSMEEGMSKDIDDPQRTSKAYNTATDKKKLFDKEKYPVDGYQAFGLDTFSSQAPELIKKGYLPKDFNKNYKAFIAPNEKGALVNSAAFTTEDAALQAKAAMLRNTRDNLQDYEDKNKIELTPKQLDFFNLVGYNAGEGTMKDMIKSYNEKGYLKDDKFLTDDKFKPASYPDPYTYAQRRLVNRDRLNDEGHFGDYKSTNSASVTDKNLKDWNSFVDSGSTDLKDYIKKNPNTSLSENSAPAIQKEMANHKEFLKKQVNSGNFVYAPGVTHDNLMKNTPAEKHKFHPKYIQEIAKK